MSGPAIRVRIPATIANLGPGFDSLGLAVNLWNLVEIKIHGNSVRVTVSGEGSGRLPTDESNPIIRAFLRLYEVQSVSPPAGLLVRCVNRIPLGAGLGSSAAAALSGLVAANALLGCPFSQGDILRLAVEIEGHPDNSAPALMGGLVAVTHGRDHNLVARRLPVRRLAVSVAVPNIEFPTQAARAALPAHVSLNDAVLNIGRAVLVSQALASGDLETLAQVMEDRLHQPYRLPLIPGARQAMQAAREAGASAVFLAGAGPSLAAFSKTGDPAIVQAMTLAFERSGIRANGFSLRVNRRGVAVCPSRR